MRYRIEYDTISLRARNHANNGSWFSILTMILASVLIICVLVFGRKQVMEFFIPGDPQITEYAWHIMLDELECGSSFENAVSAFYETMIHYE